MKHSIKRDDINIISEGYDANSAHKIAVKPHKHCPPDNRFGIMGQ